MKSIIACIFLFGFVCAQENGNAYSSYHLYAASQPLTQVSCSDGKWGLITRWGYHDMSKMFPYVAAWDQAGWNSPKCGQCIKMSWGSKSIFVTVIDQCGGPTPGHDTHLETSREAFYELFGEEGITKGTMSADWQVVQNGHCKGSHSNMQY